MNISTPVLYERLGDKQYNNSGEEMTIIKYDKASQIVVQFEDGHIKRSNYKSFLKGWIRNPYYKFLFGIGYLGEGKYKAQVNHKITKCYKTWTHMFERCYDLESYEKQHSYANCSVIEEWHNYQNFAEWFYNNIYYIPNSHQAMCIDKDILIKGNKIYSPDTCVFVPQDINSLFTKDEMRRGKYPIGVTYNKDKCKFFAQCNVNGTVVRVGGAYNDPEVAFRSYKKFKEKLIKQIANKYKDYIPQKLYDAMYVYEVEITD